MFLYFFVVDWVFFLSLGNLAEINMSLLSYLS